MDIKHSLKQRIVIVFALMSTLVAGVFAVGIIATVHVVEKRLTTISLGGNLHRQLTQDRVEDWRHRPEKDELFYADEGIGDVAMSDDLKNLKPGFQEFFRGTKAYYAMVETVGGRRYVLLRDQDPFEKRERILFAVVLVGFILSVLLAILLGRLLASRVMAPVSRLAGQVRHRDQLLELAPTLAHDYAGDEVGALARSFDETLDACGLRSVGKNCLPATLAMSCGHRSWCWPPPASCCWNTRALTSGRARRCNVSARRLPG